MIKAIDIAWAAGFIEGEGHFSSGRKGGVIMGACQAQREPLERLQNIFGGKITGPFKFKTYKPMYRWNTYGRFAASIAMTIFCLLSPRRKEQALALIDRKSGGGGKECRYRWSPYHL